MSINKIFKNKKGQIVSLTIFIVLISLGTTLVFFMPINQQVIRLRKLLNTFQALTYSESGIEFANYYAIKNQNIGNFTISGPSCSSFAGSQCEIFARRFGIDLSGFTSCCYTVMSKLPEMNVEIYSSFGIDSNNITKLYSKTISQGGFKRIQRILDFDFAP